MISLENVSYWYPGGGGPALKGVSLRLSAGEVLGVAGANESGKSTLCLVAAGLAPRVVGGRLEGVVKLEGRAAMLFESPAAQLTGIFTTVFEEVAFGPCNLGLPPAEVRSRTETALDSTRTGHLRSRDPARLSGGERQLVGLAALLAMAPGLLVLDEPLSRLDQEAGELVARVIERLAASGMAMVIAEHDRGFLSRVCGSVMEL